MWEFFLFVLFFCVVGFLVFSVLLCFLCECVCLLLCCCCVCFCDLKKVFICDFISVFYLSFL